MMSNKTALAVTLDSELLSQNEGYMSQSRKHFVLAVCVHANILGLENVASESCDVYGMLTIHGFTQPRHLTEKAQAMVGYKSERLSSLETSMARLLAVLFGKAQAIGLGLATFPKKS